MHDVAAAPGTAFVVPHPAHCPPWCSDCTHNLDPPGTVLHRSAPATVKLYDEACELIEVHVRAAFWDKTPDWIGTDPADIERPHVEVRIATMGGIPLYLDSGYARVLAAALVRAADAADTEAIYRPPGTPGASSDVTVGTVALGRA